MPIKSYIVWPAQGKKAQLSGSLAAIPGCEVLPAENQDVLVLVTETASDKAEEALFEKLQNLDAMQCLTLVAGASEGDLVDIQSATKEAV